MTFTKDAVTFTHYAEGAYRVEIKAGDGSIIKRNVAESELDEFCDMHGFSRGQVEAELSKLQS